MHLKTAMGQCVASIEEKKSEDKSVFHPSSLSILPLSSRKAVKEAPANFSQKQKKKGFINYVFCRNWAVRNPAGTRLDSSRLVNKQVVYCTAYSVQFTVYSVQCTVYSIQYLIQWTRGLSSVTSPSLPPSGLTVSFTLWSCLD